MVCIGRGIANQDDLSLVQGFVDTVNGMLGCTRPISHEYNWLAEDQMVGLSGVEASPRLYVAIGVSGQIQNTAGIMNAKAILAINNDRNAPVFNISDYGIVGDLYEIAPRLTDRIRGG